MSLSPVILYEDEDLIIAHKPMGMPSQDDKSGDPSLLTRINPAYHLVNRLDRPVSGAIILAKTKEAQTALSQASITKKYIAITFPIKDDAGELVHYLFHDAKAHRSRVSKYPKNNYKESRLSYKKLGSLDNYDVLEIELHSGRFHQIRAQLSAVGSSVKGDLKYGAARSNRGGGIDLHSYSIVIAERGIAITAPMDREDNIWKAAADFLSI